MKAIIFDFDGVIHDTFDFHLTRLKRFCSDLTDSDLREAHEGNIFCDKNKLMDIDLTGYGDYIFKDISQLEMSPMIRVVLENLSRDHDLYIVTSGRERNIKGYLERNHASDLFKAVLGMETAKSKKDKFRKIMDTERLSTEDILFITDTLGDIIEAKALGLRVIAVEGGYHSKATLLEGEPECILPDLSKLEECLAFPTVNTE